MAGNQMVVATGIEPAITTVYIVLTDTTNIVYSATIDPDFNLKQMAIYYFISLKFPIIV